MYESVGSEGIKLPQLWDRANSISSTFSARILDVDLQRPNVGSGKIEAPMSKIEVSKVPGAEEDLVNIVLSVLGSPLA